MNRLLPKVALAVVALAGVVLFFKFNLGQYLTLDYVKGQQDVLNQYYAQNTFVTIAVYLAVYIVSTALSFPGATILTLLGGAIFGVFWGTVIVSLASTTGATCAFLAARFILRDSVQSRFGDRMKTINDGVRRDGDFYLFTLRLVPIVPFFVINLVMGLTPIKAWRFFFVSQIGMLAGTAVYVNAGTQLSKIASVKDVVSPGLLASFIALGVFPLIARRIIQAVKARKVMSRFKRPTKFDYNVVAIGAGAGGLVSSYIAAAVRAKVALIEKHKMGGDCLNTGCVPSKALIRSARFLSEARRARELGFKEARVEFDFNDVMERVHRVIKTVEPHDSIERYTSLGVDCIQGAACIKSPYEVEVNGRVLTTRNIIVATGGRPLVPDIPGIKDIGYYTSDTIWELRELPRRLLVLGAGPIGSELAQCFARFGSEVTIVDRSPQLLAREDPDVSRLVRKRFETDGISVRVSHKAVGFVQDGVGKALMCDGPDGQVRLEFDAILIALGRKANVEGFGLQELGVRLASNGTIETDEFLRTNFPNVFACGDVTGTYQFTHTAAHEAWYASVNALFSGLRAFKADYSVIPWATYTDPEVARVGHNETSAREAGIPFEVTAYGIDDLDRAIADEEAHGFVKVLTVPGKDKILGVTIVGSHAGDIIAEYVAAMRHGFGMNKILSTIHIYPTMAEANKYAAGIWKKAHAPEKLLGYVERFHSFRRGEGFQPLRGKPISPAPQSRGHAEPAERPDEQKKRGA